MIKRILALALLASVAVLADARSIAVAQPSEPPNILLIIADDMGLDASPCHPGIGTLKPSMPVLERMCREGIVFDNVYSAPVCSPARATMMTGRYGFRTAVGTVVRPDGKGAPGLKLSEKTIFQFLDEETDQKYPHAVIGKWHLADKSNGGALHPEKAGAGYYAGVLSGQIKNYYNWPRHHKGKSKQVATYITSELTNESGVCINRQRKPWLLWLAHVAPHLPLHLPPKNLHGRFELNGEPPDIRARPRDYYFAALEALDKEIGNLLARMAASVRDNTVVIFIGDNGTPPPVIQDYPQFRSKASVFEGGTHVSMVVWGKGVLRRGARDSSLINTTDMFATIAELAGIDTSKTKMPEDSISFAKLLRQSIPTGRKFAYVEHFGPQDMPLEAGDAGRLLPAALQAGFRVSMLYGHAIRDTRWKYLEENRRGKMLFDLQRDPLEKVNLLAGGHVLTRDEQSALLRLKLQMRNLRGK